MLDQVLSAVDSGREEAIAGLKEFLAIPSVSTKPEHAADLRRCAQWVAERLRRAKLSVEIAETGGHPVVLAKNEHKAGRPTVLFYGHYDVQPAEPLELWKTPAFEPVVRDGAIYARGACDDKGQVWAHVQAIFQWQKHGGLPVNLVMLIEGEEEIGSGNLERFIEKRKNDLRADIAVISDTSQFDHGLPAITYGVRGLTYMEVTIKGLSHDVHSGVYGGSVPNPANVLVELLATLHDAEGRVNLPGFYEDVVALSAAERAEWKKLPFDERGYQKELGAKGLMGEAGYSTLERRWARPTCDINGLTSGYQGPGGKTIIPSHASAKVSMRLVANQDPKRIKAIFEKTLRERCPKCVTIEFAEHGLATPVVTPREGEAMKLAAEAVEVGFGTRPVLIREGGTLPILAMIKQVLGIDTLLVGFALPDDRVHSPNEKFDLEALYKGTRTAAVLYEKLGGMKG